MRGNLRLKDKKLKTKTGIGKLHHKESITSWEEKDRKSLSLNYIARFCQNMLIIVVTRSRDRPWTVKYEYVKHAHSKRKKHTQSKTNRESTIKGSISKREDHADSTQIGRTLYSGMKRESSQSHTSGTVHSSTHLTIKVVVRVEVMVSRWLWWWLWWWSSWKSKCLKSVKRQFPPNIKNRQRDHLIRNYYVYF